MDLEGGIFLSLIQYKISTVEWDAIADKYWRRLSPQTRPGMLKGIGRRWHKCIYIGMLIKLSVCFSI